MKNLFPILLVLFVLGALVLAVAGGVLVVWMYGSAKQVVGTVLIYEIEGEPGGRQTSLGQKVVAAIDRRVNPGGWSSNARVRQLDNGQIEVGVFGNDPEQVRRIERLLERAGTLEFRILANPRDHKDLIARAEAEGGDRLFDPDDPSTLLAWWVPVDKLKRVDFDRYMFREDGKEIPPSQREIAIREKQGGGNVTVEILVVKDFFNVTGHYLRQAMSSVDNRGQPCVNFRFNSQGAKLFGGLTSANLPDRIQDFSRKLGIILDGRLHSAPGIQSAIYERGEITGSFTREEVEDIVGVLNAGAMPARITQVEKRTGS